MFTAYKRYADFQGRSSRSEYWLFVLFFTVVAFALVGLQVALNDSILGVVFSIIYAVFALGSFVPSLAVAIRRLHDIDKSGWFLLIGLIPILGGLILLVMNILPGTKGPNRFGRDPLGQADAEVFA